MKANRIIRKKYTKHQFQITENKKKFLEDAQEKITSFIQKRETQVASEFSTATSKQ